MSTGSGGAAGTLETSARTAGVRSIDGTRVELALSLWCTDDTEAAGLFLPEEVPFSTAALRAGLAGIETCDPDLLLELIRLGECAPPRAALTPRRYACDEAAIARAGLRIARVIAPMTPGERGEYARRLRAQCRLVQ